MSETSCPVALETIAKSYLDNGAEFDVVRGSAAHGTTLNDSFAKFDGEDQLLPFFGNVIPIRMQFEFDSRRVEGVGTDIVLKHGLCRIYMNELLVYTFEAGEVEVALRRAAAAIEWFKRFELVRYWTRKEVEGLKGRKVYYWGQPATIEVLALDRGQVILRADTEAGRFTPFPDDQVGLPIGHVTVQEDLLSPQIYWYRD